MMSATTSTALNSTSRDAEGSVADGPRWRFLPLVAVPLWILVGNSLVLLAVARQRSLRTLSNSVIASLAFADFLLALLVVPFGVYQLVSSRIIVVVVVVVVVVSIKCFSLQQISSSILCDSVGPCATPNLTVSATVNHAQCPTETYVKFMPEAGT